MSNTKTLDGKRIVVTRSIEQAREFKQRLENLGAVVLMLPAVSFRQPSDTKELDRAIRSLDTFDWVLFTSANAARFFAGRCRELALPSGGDQKIQCAAVGPATASAAATEGFLIDYVAQEFLGVALAREMREALSGKRVLLPRSDRAGRDLPDALRAVGAEVTEVMVYLTGGVGVAAPEVLNAVREGRVDVISFFSPSAVENLSGEFGAETLSQLGAKVALAAIGPVTATALRNAALPVAIEAVEATAESMTTAIQNYFSARAATQARAQ